MAQSQAVRTVWISDLHLGTKACQADVLLQFLSAIECDRLFLVGDVIDLVQLRRSVYWPPAHTEVLRQILLMSRNGTRITYIPGNHDDQFRRFAGFRFGNLDIALRAIHTTASGQRLLVTHGDEFDGMLRSTRFGALAGSIAYITLLSCNRLIHSVRRLLGLPYWSLAQHVKTRIGKAVHYINRFRNACLAAAEEAGVDGVVCGHIHLAELHVHGARVHGTRGLIYANDGDWVESCSALVEDARGELRIVRWHAQQASAGIREAVRKAA